METDATLRAPVRFAVIVLVLMVNQVLFAGEGTGAQLAPIRPLACVFDHMSH